MIPRIQDFVRKRRAAPEDEKAQNKVERRMDRKEEDHRKNQQ